jgi:hypothetical protein
MNLKNEFLLIIMTGKIRKGGELGSIGLVGEVISFCEGKKLTNNILT